MVLLVGYCKALERARPRQAAVLQQLVALQGGTCAHMYRRMYVPGWSPERPHSGSCERQHPNPDRRLQISVQNKVRGALALFMVDWRALNHQ
jgi:hypothetical protein